MDDSDKGLFSSSTATIKPSAIPKFSTIDAGRTDENAQNGLKMGSKSHNLLKKPPIKHFMSPTASAASKASAPIKKVLVETNKVLNSTHNNTTNLDSKISPLCSPNSSVSNRVTPVQSRGYESDDDEQNTCVSKPSLAYDPLTNYLSPRPKFLRYKPNRRREIFVGEENKIGKENVRSGVKSSVSLDYQRGFVKQEDGENVTWNEQDEGSGVKSSASLASQRNISKKENVPSSQGGIEGQKDEKINELNGDHQEDDSDEEMEEFEKENYSVLKKLMEFLLVFGILFLSTIYICSMNSPLPSLTPQAFGRLKDGYHQIQNHTSEFVNFLELRSLPLVQTEGMQFKSSVGFQEEVKTEGNINGLVESADELVEVVDVEKTVGFPLEENAESKQVLDQLKGMELSDTTEKSEYVQVEVEDKAETIKEVLDDGVEKEVVEIKMEERVEEGLTETADGNSKGEVEVVGEFLLVLAIAALSVLGFHFWRKKTSLSTEKPLSESILAEKITSEGPVVLSYVEEKLVEKVEPFVNPSPSLRSMEEEFYQIRAPTVELLGELVVGDVSSSIKSCGMESKMMKIEVSSNSVVQKGTGSKAHVYSSPVKPSASEFSTMKSPSYGSFTDEKISKKEESKDREMKSAAATTVRRSSRLRSRAVMSP